MKTLVVILSWMALQFTAVSGQDDEYLKKSWKEVSRNMPDEWYGSAAALAVAENVLLCQKEIGGWAKNESYHHPMSEDDKAQVMAARQAVGATIDNGATTMEMRFLAKVYEQQGGAAVKEGFVKGLNYLLEAQYDNGGWPQFYPARGKDHYSSHITYNDNAIVHVMMLLRGVYEGHQDFDALNLSAELKDRSRAAFDNGVTCILNTQILVDGEPTVWCAQHDAKTLAPAQARAYELPSFSGAESVGLVSLLMDIENPRPEVVRAIEGAITWFETYKIEGLRMQGFRDEDGNRDRRVVEDPDATPLWGRFYDLEKTVPFFCDRDGIKKWSMAEIGRERRAGYGWYTNQPAKVLKKYPEWRKKWGSELGNN
jgi:PelA/Pel-15E family pectate lyase